MTGAGFPVLHYLLEFALGLVKLLPRLLTHMDDKVVLIISRGPSFSPYGPFHGLLKYPHNLTASFLQKREVTTPSFRNPSLRSHNLSLLPLSIHWWHIAKSGPHSRGEKFISPF